MELWSLLALCGLATYAWRGPGVFLAARLGAHGAVLTWASCVAYAMIAALVSRMLLMPTGALADTTLIERALGSAVALLVYFRLTRRNLFAGVAAAAAALWLTRLL